MNLSMKQIVVLVITTVTLSASAIFYINNVCASTLDQAEKQFVNKSEFTRIEENVKNINIQLERIEKKLDIIIQSSVK